MTDQEPRPAARGEVGAIRLTDPEHGGKVAHTYMVRGVVRDEPARVQVLVQARDGRWYLQAPVHWITRHRFSCRCAFGYPDSSSVGGLYTIVAVIPDETIVESPLDSLPNGIYSASRQVTRVDHDPNRPTGYDNPKPVGEGSQGPPQDR